MAICAVSRVRPKRVWITSSTGMLASCVPRRRASSRPSSVSGAATDGSPLTRFASLSVEFAWRLRTTSCRPRAYAVAASMLDGAVPAAALGSVGQADEPLGVRVEARLDEPVHPRGRAAGEELDALVHG